MGLVRLGAWVWRCSARGFGREALVWPGGGTVFGLMRIAERCARAVVGGLGWGLFGCGVAAFARAGFEVEAVRLVGRRSITETVGGCFGGFVGRG